MTWFRRALYQPEFEKWGGRVGVQAAEEVFCLSSTMAAPYSSRPKSERLGMALWLLGRSISSLPKSQRISFLHAYSWYWRGGPAGGFLRSRRPYIEAAKAQNRSVAAQVDGLDLFSSEAAVPIIGYLSALEADCWDTTEGINACSTTYISRRIDSVSCLAKKPYLRNFNYSLRGIGNENKPSDWGLLGGKEVR